MSVARCLDAGHCAPITQMQAIGIWSLLKQASRVVNVDPQLTADQTGRKEGYVCCCKLSGCSAHCNTCTNHDHKHCKLSCPCPGHSPSCVR
jgi:hypothetical protein